MRESYLVLEMYVSGAPCSCKKCSRNLQILCCRDFMVAGIQVFLCISTPVNKVLDAIEEPGRFSINHSSLEYHILY